MTTYLGRVDTKSSGVALLPFSVSRGLLVLPSVSSSGGGSGGASPVVLPAAWVSLALPVGYIGPLLGQLAMARGEVAAYSLADKTLSIGGRVLIGTAGKVFAFGAQSAADMWVSVNKARVQKELEVIAALPVASLAAWRAAKMEKMQARAVAITANAAKMADSAKRAALAAEAGFYSTKWS